MARIRRHPLPIWGVCPRSAARLHWSAGFVGRRRFRRAPRPPNKTAGSQQAAFRGFVETLWPLAEARGVSRPTFDSAFAGVAFDPTVVASAASQPEFVRPIWDYVASAVSADRIQRGRDKARLGSPVARESEGSLRR